MSHIHRQDSVLEEQRVLIKTLIRMKQINSPQLGDTQSISPSFLSRSLGWVDLQWTRYCKSTHLAISTDL